MKKISILIIDDNEIDRFSIRRFLSKITEKTYEVIDLASAEEGLKLCLSKQPHCLLIDYNMPAMNGIEFINELRRRLPKNELTFPIIMLTGAGNEMVLTRAMKLGVADYIVKNKLTPEKLHLAIDNAINKFHDVAIITEDSKRDTTQPFRDLLTQLPNRFGFEELTKQNLKNANLSGKVLAILLVDIDDFKAINAQYGHDVGDILLLEISKRLQSIVHDDDIVTHLGADEFAIILTNIEDAVNAAVVAESILQNTARPFNLPSATISMSVSIGISCYPDTADNFMDLCRQADQALVRAKSETENSYQYYNKELGEKLARQIIVLDALKNALANDEFYLVYQPQYCLKSKNITGCEVLIRWNNNTIKNAGPDVFIPLAEEHNLINDIGSWVIKKSCEQLQQWKKLNLIPSNFLLSLNISANQLDDPEFISFVQQTTKAFNIETKLLEFELTETAVMNNQEHNDQMIKSLSKLGIGIAIDDFGTGYSSLTRVAELPISTLKIDKSFITTLPSAGKNIVIITTIIELANKLNIRLIAEGIETKEQEQFLVEHGCAQGQGYLFSKPLDPSAFERFMLP